MAKIKRKKGKFDWVYTLIIIVCACIAAFAAYKLISIQLDYKAGEDEYDRLRLYTTVRDSGTADGETGTKTNSGTPDKNGSSGDGSGSSSGDDPANTFVSEAPIEVNHEALISINPDYAGWLYMGELDISYPLVKGSDNDYYLHRSIEGNYLYAGTLFLDASNSPDFSDANTIIYGHNMKDMSMFGKFKNLRSQSSISDRYFWILTPGANYKYRIFSTQVCTDGSSVYTLFSESTELFGEYVNEWLAASNMPGLDIDGALDPERVVTLSTCFGTGDDGIRYVVQGILVLEENYG